MRWILLNADGTTAAQLMMDGDHRPGRLDNPGKLKAARVDRFGNPGERWVRGAWRIVDAEAQADAVNAAHIADHGAISIDLARRQKATEARMILAGVALDGLVAAEALATGQDIATLAKTIADAATASEAAEIQRIAARRLARKERT